MKGKMPEGVRRQKGEAPSRSSLHFPGTTGGTSSRVRLGQALALHFLNDKKYRRNLMARLRMGEAGAIEVYLWRYAFGDPPKDDSAREEAERRFAIIREEMRALLKDAPERAREISAVVTRAPRLLPMPRLLHGGGEAEAAQEPDVDAEAE